MKYFATVLALLITTCLRLRAANAEIEVLSP